MRAISLPHTLTSCHINQPTQARIADPEAVRIRPARLTRVEYVFNLLKQLGQAVYCSAGEVEKLFKRMGSSTLLWHLGFGQMIARTCKWLRIFYIKIHYTHSLYILAYHFLIKLLVYLFNINAVGVPRFMRARVTVHLFGFCRSLRKRDLQP